MRRQPGKASFLKKKAPYSSFFQKFPGWNGEMKYLKFLETVRSLGVMECCIPVALPARNPRQ